MKSLPIHINAAMLLKQTALIRNACSLLGFSQTPVQYVRDNPIETQEPN
jgi:hypothetical protein